MESKRRSTVPMRGSSARQRGASRTSSKPKRLRQPSRSVTSEQKAFLRSVLNVLIDVMNERSSDDAKICEDEQSVHAHEAYTTSRHSEPGVVEISRSNEKNEDLYKPQPGVPGPIQNTMPDNTVKIKKLCDDYKQLSRQMRGHLDSLGGGGRTAKALEAMEIPFNELKLSIVRTQLNAIDCVNAFSKLLSCAKEMAASLEEFSIFNAEFSESNEELQKILHNYLEMLRTQNCHIGCIGLQTEGYINDIVLQDVASTLERYLKEVSSIAEKELVALHLSQDFATSRYLNLTTVATFFSSVTATTLQTSFGNSQSNISCVTNIFWFMSLSFSVASAIYSLLVMTWKQSSVCPPKKLKPSWLVAWLMRGPMFCLIVSAASFSVGLCLLAFEADQGLLTPLITTAFTMGHAWILISLSCWFAFEQWKLHYGVPSLSFLASFKPQELVLLRKIILVCNHAAEYICAMAKHKTQTDMELGDTSPSSLSKVQSIGDYASNPDHVTVYCGPRTALPESQSAIPCELIGEGCTENSTKHNLINKELKARVSMRCMQFECDGRFLAFTGRNHISCVVYEVLGTKLHKPFCVLPHPNIALEQISWRPSRFSPWLLHLCTKAQYTVFLWDILDKTLLKTIEFKDYVTSIQWAHDGNDIFCASGNKIDIFDVHGNHTATHKLLRKAVIDFASIHGTNHLLCISKNHSQDHSFSSKELYADQIFVYDLRKREILQGFNLEERVHSLDLSRTGKIALLYSCAVPGSYVSYDDPHIDRKIETWTVYDGKPRDFMTQIWSNPSAGIDNKHFNLRKTMYSPEQEKNAYPLSCHASMNPCFYGEDHVILWPSLSGYTLVGILDQEPIMQTSIHEFKALSEEAKLSRPVCCSVSPGAVPYILAFRDADGTVKLWLILSYPSYKSAAVLPSFLYTDFDFDHITGRSATPLHGKLAILPPHLGS